MTPPPPDPPSEESSPPPPPPPSIFGAIRGMFRLHLPYTPSPRDEFPFLVLYILVIWSLTIPTLPAMAIGVPIAAILYWLEPVVYDWIDRRFPED